MARRIQNVTELQQMKAEETTEIGNTLDELIPYYGNHKAELDKLDKLCKDANSKIKAIMRNSEDDTATVGDWTAKFSVRESASMNEEQLIEYLKSRLTKKQLKELGLIQTKEYVDENALENAIYNELIDTDVISGMDACKEVKYTEYLTVKKAKGAK